MIARIRKSIDEKDKGFTLIELLVVIIIIGILAAIAIPIFLNQRKKAVDAAAKADLTNMAKQIATFYVDNTGPVTSVSTTGGQYRIVATGFTAANNNDLIGPMSGSIKTATVAVTGNSAANFVVKLSYTGGTVDPGVFTYDAAAGLSGPAGS